MTKTQQSGLDGRHRDAAGRISQKHDNTRVDTLRETYGDGFLQVRVVTPICALCSNGPTHRP